MTAEFMGNINPHLKACIIEISHLPGKIKK